MNHKHPKCHECGIEIKVGESVLECEHCQIIIHQSCHLKKIANNGGEKKEDFINEKIQNWLTKQIDQHSKRLKSKFRK